MKTLYLDCFSGISGDMTVAALLSAGLDLNVLQHELSKLSLAGYRIQAESGLDGSLAGMRFQVHLDETSGQGTTNRLHTHSHSHGHGHSDHEHEHSHHSHEDEHEHVHAHEHEHVHAHEHAHEHEHVHAHEHEHVHAHEHEHVHAHEHEHVHAHEHEHIHAHEHEHVHAHHHWADIRRLIQTSPLSDGVKARALAIFAVLAEAEGRIHGIPTDEVAFHEVGAIDSIIDIVGVAIGLEALGIEEVTCSLLPLSHGQVVCQHGILPLPAPATLELLKGLPVYDSGREGELITPTGAAILKALVRQGGEYPRMKLERIGYGLGQRRGGRIPNALRAIVGEPLPASTGAPGGHHPAGRSSGGAHPSSQDLLPGQPLTPSAEASCWLLEVNIDDMNPQLFPGLLEQLMAEGALDVTVTSALMKKGRPGQVLQVLCDASKRHSLADLIMRSSTSIGVRGWPVQRWCLERRLEPVMTRYGMVRVKVSGQQDETWQATPEFEDCVSAAKAHGVPTKYVYLEAIRQALEHYPLG